MRPVDEQLISRLEGKIDRLMEVTSRLERRVEALERRRPVRNPRPDSMVIRDPALARRIHERVKRYEASPEYARIRKHMEEETARRGDPDWPFRDLLERVERAEAARAAEED
jgi:hypothetical protein